MVCNWHKVPLFLQASRLLLPQILAVEPSLVPSSQAVGSQRRGSVLSAHCSWALFAAAVEAKTSAGALYSDIKSAYYSVIREYVVGFIGPEAQLRA